MVFVYVPARDQKAEDTRISTVGILQIDTKESVILRGRNPPHPHLNKNTTDIILQVGSERVECKKILPLPHRGREAVFKRLSSQMHQIKVVMKKKTL